MLHPLLGLFLALSHKYVPMHVDSRGNALPGKRVLILGCGNDSSCPDSRHAHLGCDTLDISPGRRPTFLRDMWGLGSHPLPVPDKYYDLVFTEHCPLFLDRCKPVDKLHGVVRELFRIAKSPDAVRVEIVERLPLWTVEEIARFVSCSLTTQMFYLYEGVEGDVRAGVEGDVRACVHVLCAAVAGEKSIVQSLERVLRVIRGWADEDRHKRLASLPGQARVFVFRFPVQGTWRPVVSVYSDTDLAQLVVLVDDYNTYSDSWTVRGPGVMTFLQTHIPGATSWPFGICDVSF